ncbi:MAG TPA: hypothetical protein PKA37_09470 [Planctomycetota bacterium]|nr:hypothetical protein [Planctomycetota bacterium]
MNLRSTPLTLGLLLIIASATFSQSAVHDLFNRANNGSLGLDWTEQDGNANIASNRMTAASPFSVGWSSHNTFSANYADTVVRLNWSTNNLGGDMISLIAGVNPNTWQGIEVRVADNNGDGLSDRIFFNAAVNAGNWYGGSLFYNIATPLASGEATLWFTNAGDTANLRIRNLTTGATETFSGSGILSNPPTGTAVGVGYFGDGYADNFRAFTGSPDGIAYTVEPARIGTSATFMVSNATPNGAAYLALSTAGNGPIATGIGNVFLSLPIFELAILPLDAAGSVLLPIGVLPPALLGIPVHHQALDLSAPVLSNAFTTVGF